MKLTPSNNKSLATLCSKRATSLTVTTVEGFLSSLLTESVRHLRIWFQKHKKSWMHAENRERASEPHDDWITLNARRFFIRRFWKVWKNKITSMLQNPSCPMRCILSLFAWIEHYLLAKSNTTFDAKNKRSMCVLKIVILCKSRNAVRAENNHTLQTIRLLQLKSVCKICICYVNNIAFTLFTKSSKRSENFWSNWCVCKISELLFNLVFMGRKKEKQVNKTS